MNRRTFLCGVALGLIGVAGAEAQQPGRVYRIGYLNPGGATLAPIRLDPLKQGLRDLGYVEGQNLVVDARWAEGNVDRLSVLAGELVAAKVDVIVTASAPAARAARDATKTIPVVMVDPGDPVGSGLVSSLARPGGNLTGLSSATPDIVGKQVQLLKEALPTTSLLVFLSNPGVPAGAVALKEADKAAEMAGLRLQAVSVRDPGEFETVVAAVGRDHAMLIVFPDPLTFTHRRRLMELAIQHRVPVMSGSKEFADAGGLLTYGPSFGDMFRRAAVYVDRILHGTKPADLPVEQPTTFELVVNLKTARALGISVPPALVQRADKVID